MYQKKKKPLRNEPFPHLRGLQPCAKERDKPLLTSPRRRRQYDFSEIRKLCTISELAMADVTIDMTRLERIQDETPQITPQPHQDPSTSELYTSLELSTSNRSVRLLRVDQNRSFDAQLTGKLQVVSLKRSPHFTALSYVWGSFSTPSDTITCNGVSVNISTNCRNALREIRRQSQSRVTIWVDAICINQADIVERSSQIRLMGEIFSWASHVYIWLGKGNYRSDEAFACLNKASRLRMALIGVRAVSSPQRAISIMKVISKLADISWNPIMIRGK
jgi:hypothetical protein